MDSKHLYIYNQNGVGRIVCKDCGNIEYNVLSFTHGFGERSCSTYGVQCQECGAFDRHWSFNEADFADIDEDEPEVKYTGRSIIFKIEVEGDEDEEFGDLNFAIFLPKWLRRFFPPEVEEIKKPTRPQPPREDCPKCHSLKITNSNPVFCPKCRSYNVKYECEYVT